MHVYVPSAPGCWAAFTSLQAHELERFGGHRAHGLVADCYMAQHPGDGSDRRDRQSVFVHLVGLCAVLERGWPNSRSLLALLTATRRQFPALTRPSDPGSICVNDLACVQDAIEYQSCAASWATEVWRSWAPAHGLIRATLDELEHAPNRPARAAAARRSGSDMAGPWAGRRCCYGTPSTPSDDPGFAAASWWPGVESGSGRPLTELWPSSSGTGGSARVPVRSESRRAVRVRRDAWVSSL